MQTTGSSITNTLKLTKDVLKNKNRALTIGKLKVLTTLFGMLHLETEMWHLIQVMERNWYHLPSMENFTI